MISGERKEFLMPKPDEHPVHEDHPGKGRGENPNPGNKPDKPEQPTDPNAPHVDNTLPGDLPPAEEPRPEQLPS